MKSSRTWTDSPGERLREDAAKPALDFEHGDIDEAAPEVVEETAAAETEGYYSPGSDDALGLYLKQMGSIPLLKRDQELQLAQRLETTRARFRRAILFYAPIVNRVLSLFEEISRGEKILDPHIDVVHTLGRSREAIASRLA